MQLTKDNPNIPRTLLNLKQLEASVFVAISPNVNWCNTSNHIAMKHYFRKAYKQVHISATSSDLGKDPQYFQRPTLIGGAAIFTLDHWASKVASTSIDPRGHGTYSVTTIQGKNGSKLSIIAAYISVQKGEAYGPNTLYAQQQTLMEQHAIKNGQALPPKMCPRQEAIKAIGEIIHELQSQNHALLLLIDANQTPKESTTKHTIKKYSIEWLRVTYGLTDPFIELLQQRPNTTTLTPNRDIDYILTYGFPTQHITTLGMNNPATSDHLGIGIDINVEDLFQGTYSTLHQQPRRILTLNNARAKRSYIQYIIKEVSYHRLLDRITELYDIAMKGAFTDTHEIQLNRIDQQLTEILLLGERNSAKGQRNRDPWSPKLCEAGRILIYWKRKMSMAKKKHFRWDELEQLRQATPISNNEHADTTFATIKKRLREARKLRQDTKLNADQSMTKQKWKYDHYSSRDQRLLT
jgi:hypothetical protein